jgi:hypothetical protein
MSDKSELYAAKLGIMDFYQRELRAALAQARADVTDPAMTRRIDYALALTATSDDELTEQANKQLGETEQ